MANVQIQLDVINQEISYNDIPKAIPNSHWTDTLVPLMYPTWDTDKDKLILFRWFDNDTYLAQRRKYILNFKTNTNEWKDYEMEQVADATATAFKDKLIESWYAIDAIENFDFQTELASMYAKTSAVSPTSVRLARDFLLDECDWTQLSDCQLSADDKALWVTYRQKLRDLTTDANFNTAATEVKFPISPNFYNKIHKVENPSDAYLATDTQWLKSSSHYLRLFNEKIAHYLTLKSVTENHYFDRLLIEYNKMKQDTVPPELTSEVVQEKKDWLEKVIKVAQDEIDAS